MESKILKLLSNNIEFCKIEIRLIVVDNRTRDNPNNILYDSFKGSMSPDVEKVFNFTKYPKI